MITQMTRKLEEINERLKHGEGWIGYRYSKNQIGERIPSKFLYYAFCVNSGQKFVNTKTNDPEQAYRQLLAARDHIQQGHRLLPSEVSRFRYEDLRQILMDYYRDKKPASIYSRRTDDGGTEETFAGADALDKFFKQCTLPDITAMKIQAYIKHQRGRGIADATIRRQLGRLRSAFNRAKAPTSSLTITFRPSPSLRILNRGRDLSIMKTLRSFERQHPNISSDDDVFVLHGLP